MSETSEAQGRTMTKSEAVALLQEIPDCIEGRLSTNYAVDARVALKVLAEPAQAPATVDLRQALNRVFTVLRDLDCPLDIRVTMAYDIAQEALDACAKADAPQGEAPAAFHVETESGRIDLPAIDVVTGKELAALIKTEPPKCVSSTSLHGECPLMFHSCGELGTTCLYAEKEPPASEAADLLTRNRELLAIIEAVTQQREAAEAKVQQLEAANAALRAETEKLRIWQEQALAYESTVPRLEDEVRALRAERDRIVELLAGYQAHTQETPR